MYSDILKATDPDVLMYLYYNSISRLILYE